MNRVLEKLQKIKNSLGASHDENEKDADISETSKPTCKVNLLVGLHGMKNKSHKSSRNAYSDDPLGLSRNCVHTRNNVPTDYCTAKCDTLDDVDEIIYETIPDEPERAEIDPTTLNITVLNKSLLEVKADVHVCPVCGNSGDVDKSGVIMSEYLKQGGDDLRRAYRSSTSKVYNDGIVITESFGELVKVCEYIFFIHVMFYTPRNPQGSLQYMEDSIERCLLEAINFGLSSIAFSTIGCGNMEYPYTSVAQCFKNAVSSSGNGLQVFIAAMPDMYKKFTEHFPKNNKPNLEVSAIENLLKDSAQRNEREISTASTALYVPDYWTIRGYLITNLISNHQHRLSPLPKDSKVYKELVQLIQFTQDSESMKIVGISVVENPSLLKKYDQAKEPFKFTKLSNGPYTSLEEPPLTSAYLATLAGSILSKNLDLDINEFYLFHGTRPSYTHGIASTGLDVRLSNLKGRFGAGVYFAENPSKSNQYTDSLEETDDEYVNYKPDQSYYMFLCRVTLGNAYNCHLAREFRKPPCKKGCPIDTCFDTEHLPHFDSVFASTLKKQKLQFREFIVYDQHRCYPEFLIEYKRSQ